MVDENTKRPSNVWLGCLVLLVTIALGMFVGGLMIAHRGIGIVDGDDDLQSPVGVWKGTLNGNVMEIHADGTGALRREGRAEYFEWRLDGDNFCIYQFSKPNSTTAWVYRLVRGFGLHGAPGHDNFKLVEVTPKKLTLALDDEPHPDSSWKLGDHVEYQAVSD